MIKKIGVGIAFTAVLVVAGLLIRPGIDAAADRINGRQSGRYVFTNVAVDVTGSNGNFGEVDTEDADRCFFMTTLDQLVGGTSPTVLVTIEGRVVKGQVGLLGHPIVAIGTPHTAIGTNVLNTDDVYPRYLFLTWVTTGSPTTASMTVQYSCTR